MASSYTYATLVSALQSTVEDGGDDFLSALPNIIALAEDRVLRDLNVELFDVSATSTFGVASPWLAKPSDMVGLRTMHFTDALGNFVLLEPKSWEFVKDYWPNVGAVTASPKYYAEYSDTNWFIAGTPIAANVLTIRYIKRPAGLTALNPTTWLAAHVGDLLFYGCLISSEQFLKADNRIAVWTQEYALRLNAARRELKLEERNDYMPMTAIPEKEQ
jgi:hypothetical protein